MNCAVCDQGLAPTDHFCSACGAPVDQFVGELGIELTGAITSIINTGTGPAAVGSGVHRDLPSGAAMLVVHRGPGEGTEYSLAPSSEVIIVGRAEECDVFLDDVTVSRRHAEFRHGAQGWNLQDVGSLNGTYVNRVRVEDQKLRGGDEVQIGKFRFIFLVGVEG